MFLEIWRVLLAFCFESFCRFVFCIEFDRFLVRFWGHLGGALGSPNRSFWASIFDRFLRVVPRAAQERPRAAQERPRAAQERPRAAQERPIATQERPKSGKEPPKSGPERPRAAQERPRAAQDWQKAAHGLQRVAKNVLHWGGFETACPKYVLLT